MIRCHHKVYTLTNKIAFKIGRKNVDVIFMFIYSEYTTSMELTLIDDVVGQKMYQCNRHWVNKSPTSGLGTSLVLNTSCSLIFIEANDNIPFDA